MKTIYRYEVPVDGGAHVRPTTSEPLHIASRTRGFVEFWAEFDSDLEPWDTAYTVIGTGHPIPDGARYIGTTEADHGLVWHLYEMPPGTTGTTSTPDPSDAVPPFTPNPAWIEELR